MGNNLLLLRFGSDIFLGVQPHFHRDSHPAFFSDARTRAFYPDLSQVHFGLTTSVIEPGMAHQILVGFGASQPVSYQWCGIIRIRKYEPIDVNTFEHEKT